MRTTLDIPEKLIQQAQRILGAKSKTDAIILSLTEVIRRQRIEELKAMRGKIELYVDISASRRRPGRPTNAKAEQRRPRTL
jgi:Arc/MetJ family transcription regulator